MPKTSPTFPLAAVAAVLPLLLAACSGGGSDTPAPTPVASTLAGTAAVGAPLVDGQLRIVDANGAVVADAVPLDSAGRYAGVVLTGTGPWRLEACGWAGSEWTCLQSVAHAAGTAHVTPLTTAALVLATGTPADALMQGAAAPSAAAVDAAEGTLAQSLGALANGVNDFFGGTLDAGSRSGYDRVLDAVHVSTGSDGQPFVQLSPRLGEGNVFVQPGAAAQGSINAAAGAAALPLGQLEALFARLNEALASETACRNTRTGLAAQLAPDARLSFGPEPTLGAVAVADVLCTVFGGREPGSPEPVGPAMWGARLMSPVLGRCDFNGADAVCGVGLVLRDVDGAMGELGDLAVAWQGGQWWLLGDRHPIAVSAGARVQRDLRIDGDSVVAHFDRAFAFEVPALPGLACARVSQRDAAGARLTLAYYKRHTPGVGEGEPERLSLWTDGRGGPYASVDPAVGTTRTSDDTWLFLPEGEAGDAAIRHFLRGGRTVTVDFYADAGCTTAYDGLATRVVVDVDGVPPVWSAMADLPWPAFTAASHSALRNLVATAGTSTTMELAWSFPRGAIGFSEGFVCTDRALCGSGGAGRVAEFGLRPRERSASFVVLSGTAITAGESKAAGLYGRWRGLGVQANLTSCPGVPAGERCH